MNDEELKKLFKAQSYQQATELDIARWKKNTLPYLKYLPQNKQEWLRLAVACSLGIIIGFNGTKQFTNNSPEKNFFEESATIVHNHVNLD
jgi:hypothetical protein